MNKKKTYIINIYSKMKQIKTFFDGYNAMEMKIFQNKQRQTKI